MKKFRNIFLHSITLLILSSLIFSQDITKPDNKNNPPGVVIAHSPAKTKTYIGSPSLLILKDGTYLASHDLFGKEIKTAKTFVYRSADKGISWELISTLENQFWSNLFELNSSIYLMGTTREYGSVVIRRSTDGGKTWTDPKDKKSGIVLDDGEYHTAPVPVVIYDGRIWRSMEDRNPPTDWGKFFRTFVMSAPIDSDLLYAGNWMTTNRLSYDPAWPGSAWLEGNIVQTPSGYLWNILRNHTVKGGKAAVVKVGLTGRVVTFDPAEGFINFPGGSVKFTIRFDPVCEKYYSLTNYIMDGYKHRNPERTRNTLALISSNDLINWKIESIVLHHPDADKVGFQYVDWRIEGNDMVFLSRTAYCDNEGGAFNQHDSNFLTFHRLKNFRNNPKLFRP